MINYSQNIPKKQLQGKLVVPPHKQTLLQIAYVKKKFHILFNTAHVKDCALW